MEISQHHKLGQDEATRRIDGLLTDLEKQYSEDISDPVKQWRQSPQPSMDFSFRMSGLLITGCVIVYQTEVVLTGELPFLAWPFKGKITRIIRKYMEKTLK